MDLPLEQHLCKDCVDNLRQFASDEEVATHYEECSVEETAKCSIYEGELNNTCFVHGCGVLRALRCGAVQYYFCVYFCV